MKPRTREEMDKLQAVMSRRRNEIAELVVSVSTSVKPGAIYWQTGSALDEPKMSLSFNEN